MSAIRCASPAADVGGPPGMPTPGAIRTGAADRGDACDTKRGTNAAAIPTRIAAATAPRALDRPVMGLRLVVAGVRRGDIGERAEERQLVGIHTIGEQVVRG